MHLASTSFARFILTWVIMPRPVMVRPRMLPCYEGLISILSIISGVRFIFAAEIIWNFVVFEFSSEIQIY